MNGAPSQKGCVVIGQMTKTSNKRVRPPPRRPVRRQKTIRELPVGGVLLHVVTGTLVIFRE